MQSPHGAFEPGPVKHQGCFPGTQALYVRPPYTKGKWHAEGPRAVPPVVLHFPTEPDANACVAVGRRAASAKRAAAFTRFVMAVATVSSVCNDAYDISQTSTLAPANVRI